MRSWHGSDFARRRIAHLPAPESSDRYFAAALILTIQVRLKASCQPSRVGKMTRESLQHRVAWDLKVTAISLPPRVGLAASGQIGYPLQSQSCSKLSKP
jgi:hypothetical protein